MKLKLSLILQSINSINTLLNLKLPVAAQFKLTMAAKKLDSVVQTFQAQRQQLQDSGLSSVELQSQLQELLDIEEEVQTTKVTLEDLGSAELEGIHLFILSWMIEGLSSY